MQHNDTRIGTSLENNKSHHDSVSNTIDVSRRSLLSWLGGATVFALTADLLSACAPESPRTRLRAVAATNPTPTAGDPRFLFEPSPVEGSLYDKWWGNTVDRQNLEQILASWELNVSGLVEKPIALSFAEMLELPRQNQITDFHCVEGWSVYDVPWNGFHIDRLIELVKPMQEATHITLRSFSDIYTESIPLSVAREAKTMFAYGIDGSSMPLTHGFPLRLVVPRMYGYKNAKWVKQIEFTNAGIDGYWEQRGYPSDAPVKATKLRVGKY